MKTAVSIPDDLFRRADELAHQLGKSRSELYREALADYIARRDPQAVTEALNAIADESAADRAGFGEEAARRILTTSEWWSARAMSVGRRSRIPSALGRGFADQ